MNQQDPVIDIRNLVRRYGRTDAVDGLNLRVQPGRCYGFFGRNGAGKTTTIKCLLNLLRPTSGETRVFGLDPARHEVAVKSRVAYVPDHVAFYPWMTVTADARLLRLVPQPLEPGHRGGASRAVPARWRTEDQPSLERPADAARAHHGHLPRARPARPRRADVRTRSDRPARVHPDGHRRLSGWRPGPADGVRVDASHLGIRGPDRRVHDHRPRQETSSRSSPTPRASATRRFTCASPATRHASTSRARASSTLAGATSSLP